MKNFFEKHKRLICILAPTIIGVIYMVLCMTNLQRSIWFDESYSAYLTRYSFGDIWNLTAIDVHPPLFYFLLKIWAGIFGSIDFAMRFMSVMFGAIAIVFAFQLLKRFFSLKIAILGSLAMAISPMLIRYGQEMRMYTLVVAIVFAATYFLSLAVDTGKKKYWIIYGILVSLGMWSHYFSAIAWLAHVVWLITIYKKKIFNKNVIMAYVLAIILYLPWMYYFIKQSLGIQNGFWIGPNTGNTLTDFLGESLMFTSGNNIGNWLIIVFLFLISAGVLFVPRIYKSLKSPQRKYFRLVLFLAVLPPLILILLSTYPLKPLFVSRYIVYASAGIAILFGFIIAKPIIAKRAWLAAGAVAIVYLIASTAGLISVNNFKNSNAKGLYYDVSALSTEEGMPIVSNSEMLYYDISFYGNPEHPTYFIDEITNYQWGSQEPLRRMDLGRIIDLDGFLAQHDAFWYVGSKPEDGDFLEFPREGYKVGQVYEMEIKPGEGLYQAVLLQKDQ